MGWGRWMLLGNLGQQLDIEDQRDNVDRIRQHLSAFHREKTAAEDEIRQLRDEIDELKLYVAATFTMLTAKGIVSPAEIKNTVEAVDRSDGSSDQRFTGQVRPEG